MTDRQRYEHAMRALWSCFQSSGADVSEFTDETRTQEGRERGFQQFMSINKPLEVAEAVADLRQEYDELLEAS